MERGGSDSATVRFAAIEEAETSRLDRVPRDSPWPMVGVVTGELLLTFGVVLLLLVVYELYVTDIFTAREQHQVNDRLDRDWAAGTAPPPMDGDAFARLYLPTIGKTYAVVEGTTQDDLALGPGHYPASAMPGERGNLAIAGHRVGHGAPFKALDELRSCAPLVVETQSAWYVYRVLPLSEDVRSWRSGAGTRPECHDVTPLTGAYKGIVGRHVVTPNQSEVVAPVPGVPRANPTAALITLTTCHPQYSARQRLVVHGVLTGTYPKDRADPRRTPPELDER